MPIRLFRIRLAIIPANRGRILAWSDEAIDIITFASEYARECYHVVIPGYEKCFKDLWESNLALAIARHFPTAADIRSTGLEDLSTFCSHGMSLLRQANEPRASRAFPECKSQLSAVTPGKTLWLTNGSLASHRATA